MPPGAAALLPLLFDIKLLWETIVMAKFARRMMMLVLAVAVVTLVCNHAAAQLPGPTAEHKLL